jgi:hypothetical protein
MRVPAVGFRRRITECHGVIDPVSGQFLAGGFKSSGQMQLALTSISAGQGQFSL